MVRQNTSLLCAIDHNSNEIKEPKLIIGIVYICCTSAREIIRAYWTNLIYPMRILLYSVINNSIDRINY